RPRSRTARDRRGASLRIQNASVPQGRVVRNSRRSHHPHRRTASDKRGRGPRLATGSCAVASRRLQPDRSITKKGNLPSLFAGALVVSGCAASHQTTADKQLADIERTRESENANLANFDDLDFHVFSGQKWDQLPKSHAKDILVHYQDGHT